MVKTSILTSLPNPDILRRKAQSVALLDAIMSPDWQYRYYSFNSKWSAGEMMASMRNGCGDNFFILFTQDGAILKGLAHETPISPWAREDKSLWPGIFEGVPTEFAEFLTEPAFDIPNTTYCLWRLHNDESWRMGSVQNPDDDGTRDGSEEHLTIFIGGPEAYQAYALEYYEKNLPIESLKQIYDHVPLSDELVRSLNPEVNVPSLRPDLDEIGYPSAEKA